MDSETFKQRQRAGIERAKKLGKYKGRKPGTTKASPQKARELKDQGRSAREVAERLGIGVNTVWRYLRKAKDE